MGSNQPGQIHDIEREFRLGRLQNRGGSRMAISWLLTVLIYAILIGVLFFSVNFIVVDQSGFSGLVQVQLGSPEGLQAGIPPAGEASESPEPNPAEPNPEETQAEASPAPVESASPDVVVASPSPKATASPKASAKPSPSPKPLPSVKPTPKTTDKISPNATAGIPQVVGTPSPSASATTIVKGDPAGNSYETTFAPSSSNITVVFSVSIWLFMPLPTKIEDKNILNKFRPDNGSVPGAENVGSLDWYKEKFRALYRESVTGWDLITDSTYDDGIRLWPKLQEAGYNLSQAEYKTKINATSRRQYPLVPVRLEFDGTNPGKGQNIRFTHVEIVQSSGDPKIDQAVKDGFIRSALSINDSKPGNAIINGTFVYRFNN